MEETRRDNDLLSQRGGDGEVRVEIGWSGKREPSSDQEPCEEEGDQPSHVRACGDLDGRPRTDTTSNNTARMPTSRATSRNNGTPPKRTTPDLGRYLVRPVDLGPAIRAPTRVGVLGDPDQSFECRAHIVRVVPTTTACLSLSPLGTRRPRSRIPDRRVVAMVVGRAERSWNLPASFRR